MGSHDDRKALLGHNGGPELEEPHVPEWGDAPIGVYFPWKTAHKAAWRRPSRDMALFRLARAERLSLTYEEYTSHLLDTGRYLQAEDVETIAAIKRAR